MNKLLEFMNIRIPLEIDTDGFAKFTVTCAQLEEALRHASPVTREMRIASTRSDSNQTEYFCIIVKSKT